VIQEAIDLIRKGPVQVKPVDNGYILSSGEYTDQYRICANDLAIAFMCVATGHNIQLHVTYGQGAPPSERS
jgi:hypothetical protein